MFNNLKLKDYKEGKTGDFLLLKATNVILRNEEEKTAIVEIKDDPEIIVDLAGAKRHIDSVCSPWLESRLAMFQSGKKEVSVADPEYPLAVIFADISLILVTDRNEYLVSVYRPIFPEGWTLFGGNPNNLQEVLKPRRVAYREGAEEIMIGTTDGKIFSFFSSDRELRDNIKSWGLAPTEIVPLEMIEYFPKRGIAQRLIIRCQRRESITFANVFIHPTFAEMSIRLYLKVKIPTVLGSLMIWDCERSGETLLNRPVRLTDENGRLMSHFFNGVNLSLANWSDGVPGADKSFF